jgi:hypothetical protein
MPCATTLPWQLVAIGIKFHEIGITAQVAPVPYWLWPPAADPAADSDPGTDDRAAEAD